jgi:hypothetical protein
MNDEANAVGTMAAAASNTVTSTPSRARVIAAASPFGPDPTTTARVVAMANKVAGARSSTVRGSSTARRPIARFGATASAVGR